MMCHWFGHSKFKPTDVEKLFKRKASNNELGSTLNKNNKTK